MSQTTGIASGAQFFRHRTAQISITIYVVVLGVRLCVWDAQQRLNLGCASSRASPVSTTASYAYTTRGETIEL